MKAELIFPLENWHNHVSCIVECPKGDLLVCWYHGLGGATADDVRVEGARKRKGAKGWSRRFVLADTPGFPDCNPCMFIDPQGRLWLLWITVLANEWPTSLLRYKISTDYQRADAPRWTMSDLLPIQPGEEFVAAVLKANAEESAQLQTMAPDEREKRLKFLMERGRRANDKLLRRIGWMTRNHPLILQKRRIIVPLYSDGFNFSLMAISEDNGNTWRTSLPLISNGGVQPSIVQKRDGTLVAYMRDNGPPPKRVMRSESHDGGLSWTPVVDTELPNPGSPVEVVRLRSGNWLMVCNDTEADRCSLALLLSDDEGKTWKWKRHLEHDPTKAGSYYYASLIEGKDGSLHVTYSYHCPEGKAIKYAHFDEAWVKQD